MKKLIVTSILLAITGQANAWNYDMGSAHANQSGRGYNSVDAHSITSGNGYSRNGASSSVIVGGRADADVYGSHSYNPKTGFVSGTRFSADSAGTAHVDTSAYSLNLGNAAGSANAFGRAGGGVAARGNAYDMHGPFLDHGSLADSSAIGSGSYSTVAGSHTFGNGLSINSGGAMTTLNLDGFAGADHDKALAWDSKQVKTGTEGSSLNLGQAFGGNYSTAGGHAFGNASEYVWDND